MCLNDYLRFRLPLSIGTPANTCILISASGVGRDRNAFAHVQVSGAWGGRKDSSVTQDCIWRVWGDIM